MIRLQETYPNAAVMICGDLNARTGDWNVHDGTENEDKTQSTLTQDVNNCFCSDITYSRNSQNLCTNHFGEILKTLCKIYHICILDGSVDDDRRGKFTYLSQHGCSVIDYCMLYADGTDVSVSFRVGDKIFSSHMPLEIRIGLERNNHGDTYSCRTLISKFIWDSDKVQDVKISLQTPEFRACMSEAYELIGISAESALQLFVQTLLCNAALCSRWT